MTTDGLPPGFGPNDPTASDRSESEYAACDFKITEHSPTPDGTALPWILIQVDAPGLKVLRAGDAFLGLEFREGVTFEDAKRLAHEMDRLISGISCTKFVT
jgi:hypothetical protein